MKCDVSQRDKDDADKMILDVISIRPDAKTRMTEYYNCSLHSMRSNEGILRLEEKLHF